MFESIGPLKADSLKDVFIQRFEKLILSGKLRIGQKLPSERELAAQLGVSRPVVHEGLVELAVRGLVTMKPRVGTIVNDFRREGSIALLSSLIKYGEGSLDEGLLNSILQMRCLMEVEFARLAAINRSDDHVREMRSLVDMESELETFTFSDIIAADFEFHLLVALATGNSIYPLLINSFKSVYTNLTGQFFSVPGVILAVRAFHARLVEAIEARDSDRAVAVMSEMLNHGEDYLRGLLESAGGEPRRNEGEATTNEH